MSTPASDPQSDDAIKQEVAADLEQSKAEAQNFSAEDVKSGDWFARLLIMVAKSYDNARARDFLRKYPGLSKDEIADKLISVNTRYAAIAGGIAGAATTADQFAMVATMGMSMPIFLSTIGAEMLYLARLQMRLVLDLAEVYEVKLNTDDPEDVLMIFGYAMGIAPVDALGKALQQSSQVVTKTMIKTYLSKGTLKSIQEWGSLIGLKILQRTILKYGIPAVSMATGSTYNYVSTRTVGKLAKQHMRSKGAVTQELLDLVSPDMTYDIAFAAAVMYMAEIDGELTAQEKELYHSMLQRMVQAEHQPADFRHLLKSEANLLAALSALEDEQIRQNLLDTLILMAVYDGELHDRELAFLQQAAHTLHLPLDMEAVNEKLAEYHVDQQVGLWSKAAAWTGKASVEAASQTMQMASRSVEKMKGWRQAFGKGQSNEDAPSEA